MQAHAREIVGYLRGIGARRVTIIGGRRHPWIRFQLADRDFRMPIAASPSDVNSFPAVKGAVRRLIATPPKKGH